MTPVAVALSAAAGTGSIWAVRHLTAPTARNWTASSAPTTVAGRLATRTAGAGTSTTVLLHGIVGCGDYYGASYDALGRNRRLVVPDLLGFGDSYRAAAPSGHGLAGHLQALDEMADALRLTGPLTVVGHSMGAVLALHWAARRPARVQRVVALSAPLYQSAAEGQSRIRGLGALEAAMALDTPLSRATCAWMCEHRTAAGWAATALKPHLPVPVARRGVLHTWPAYLSAMQEVVLSSPWPSALAVLADARVPVLLAAGARDPVPVPGRADHLAQRHRALTSVTHPTAAHDLPLTDPSWCRELLTDTARDEPQGTETIPSAPAPLPAPLHFPGSETAANEV